MPSYTVKQGDYLPKIAEENGFYDYRTIWEHAKNQQLKDKRKNPNVLAPGDELFIPEKTLKKESGATGQLHPFRVKTGKLLLRLIVEDSCTGKPVANAKCELRVDGGVFTPDASWPKAKENRRAGRLRKLLQSVRTRERARGN